MRDQAKRFDCSRPEVAGYFISGSEDNDLTVHFLVHKIEILVVVLGRLNWTPHFEYQKWHKLKS